jgi:hypothetical protein
MHFGRAICGWLMFGLLMSGAVPYGTALSVGERALSRTRSGIVHGQARSGSLRRVMSRFVELCRGKDCSVLSGLGNHLHGWRGRGFDAARWHESMLVAAWLGAARWCGLVPGLVWQGNHHRVGTEADRRGRGGIRSGEPVYGESVCGKACCVLVSNHTRAGTVPDRRGRCGMNCGLQRSGASGCVAFYRVELGRFDAGQARVCSGSVCHGNQARAGTGPDQRRRLGMHSGSMRLDSARRGEPRSVTASHGVARFGNNRHRGRRGEASTPRGGM